MSRPIPYSRQRLDEDDIRAVVEVLRSDFITQGPKVGEFEEALAARCGARHAVAFSSGTAALHAAYAAAGVGMGHEVVTSPLTFAATANAALFLGARPVFADVETDTGNLSPEAASAAVTERTKAVVPVDYAGHPADLDAFRSLADRHGLVFIEDACHSLGATYRGTPVGGLADMTVFSFHPVKTITTGEGGAVLTDDGGYAEKLALFRQHGVQKDPAKMTVAPPGGWYQEMQELGTNYRLTDIQSALGLSQLKKIDAFVESRRRTAAAYNEAFSGEASVEAPAERAEAGSSWHLYPLRFGTASLGEKNRIFEELRSKGLGVQVHYLPVYSHPYYRRIGYEGVRCPKAEDFYLREISLPIFPFMEDEEVRRVIDAVRGLS